MIKLILNFILQLNEFRVFDDLILDIGLAKAMEEVNNDEEFDLEAVKKLSGFKE